MQIIQDLAIRFSSFIRNSLKLGYINLRISELFHMQNDLKMLLTYQMGSKKSIPMAWISYHDCRPRNIT